MLKSRAWRRSFDAEEEASPLSLADVGGLGLNQEYQLVAVDQLPRGRRIRSRRLRRFRNHASIVLGRLAAEEPRRWIKIGASIPCLIMQVRASGAAAASDRTNGRARLDVLAGRDNHCLQVGIAGAPAGVADDRHEVPAGPAIERNLDVAGVSCDHGCTLRRTASNREVDRSPERCWSVAAGAVALGQDDTASRWHDRTTTRMTFV